MKNLVKRALAQTPPARSTQTALLIVACLFIFCAVLLFACKKDTDKTSTATISALTCASTVFSDTTVTAGSAYTGTATVSYTGGNDVAYSAGSAISSTGVTGLTATLQAGTLASGVGNLTYAITGTPDTAGTASFDITFGGQTCSFTLTVKAATSDCSAEANSPAKVVCLANAFIATLSSSQLASAQLSLTQTNAVHWSNLPCGAACRNGLEFTNMTAAQVTAAKAIAAAATGTATDEGFSTLSQIILADSVLNANSSTGAYSSSYYFIAFLGTPSLTGTWQLQFGGHHIAVNISYNNGAVAGVTPMFQGVEPKTWTTGDTTYTPLTSRQQAMLAMLSSLTTSELASAKLSTTFSDVLLGPGTDGEFPTTKVGVAVSSLTSAQQALVVAAMKEWVENADSATAASLMTTYTNELSATYIAYSNTPYLTTNTDYVRIDGPGVWIEFICQTGVVFPSQIHYHSVWRDHTRDYGGNFSSLIQ